MLSLRGGYTFNTCSPRSISKRITGGIHCGALGFTAVAFTDSKQRLRSQGKARLPCSFRRCVRRGLCGGKRACAAAHLSPLGSDNKHRILLPFIGIDAFRNLIKCAGGTSVYIPSERRILKPVRDRLIRESFCGDYKDLATKFNISEVSIRKIVYEKD